MVMGLTLTPRLSQILNCSAGFSGTDKSRIIGRAALHGDGVDTNAEAVTEILKCSAGSTDKTRFTRRAALLGDVVEINAAGTELTLVGHGVEELIIFWTAILFTRIIRSVIAVIFLYTVAPLSIMAPDEEGSVLWAVMLPLVLVMAKVKIRSRSVGRVLHLLVLVVLVGGPAVRVVRVQSQSTRGGAKGV